jgi:hypothetical protein
MSQSPQGVLPRHIVDAKAPDYSARIIDLSIGFTHRQLRRGNMVSDALAPLEIFYADKTLTLVEITNAQVENSKPGLTLGAFQVLFKKPDSTFAIERGHVTATRLGLLSAKGACMAHIF